MNELTGTAQPPGDSSDVWRLRTHHMRQFKLIQLETAELRLLIYHIRRTMLRIMLNITIEKRNERKRVSDVQSTSSRLFKYHTWN
jgi:hypothetical protein